MALLPVDEALDRLLADIGPRGEEWIALDEASGRILSQDLVSKRTHPPFASSAMDGYAVRYHEAASSGATLKVVGESAAGHGYHQEFEGGECVRIFTGAPVPPGADTILIQENVEKLDNDAIKVVVPAEQNRNIRVKGIDFHEGDVLLKQSRELDYSALTLAAGMDYPQVPVFRKPTVSVLATGDELVLPGQDAHIDQIVASNSFGIRALSQKAGGNVHDLGIAKDKIDDIQSAISRAMDAQTDILVTIGGASVGDHDLVQQALTDMGMELSFWKIAMRPGKPLMFGQIDNLKVIGLPGNPASSLVTAVLFLTPVIQKMAGRGFKTQLHQAKLTIPFKANDQRQDYLRSKIVREPDGSLSVTPYSRQDSSLVRVFAESNGLMIRPPHAEAAEIGDLCDVILFN